MGIRETALREIGERRNQEKQNQRRKKHKGGEELSTTEAEIRDSARRHRRFSISRIADGRERIFLRVCAQTTTAPDMHFDGRAFTPPENESRTVFPPPRAFEPCARDRPLLQPPDCKQPGERMIDKGNFVLLFRSRDCFAFVSPDDRSCFGERKEARFALVHF